MPLLQMLKDSPVTAAEAKEMALRHVLAAPHDPKSAEVTDKLLEVWEILWHQSNPELRPLEMVHGKEAYDLVRENFIDAFAKQFECCPDAADWWTWPVALANPTYFGVGGYPRDFLIMLGQALGTHDGEHARDSGAYEELQAQFPEQDRRKHKN